MGRRSWRVRRCWRRCRWRIGARYIVGGGACDEVKAGRWGGRGGGLAALYGAKGFDSEQ